MPSRHTQSIAFAFIVLAATSIGSMLHRRNDAAPLVSDTKEGLASAITVAQISSTVAAAAPGPIVERPAMQPGRILTFATPQPRPVTTRAPSIAAHATLLTELGTPYPLLALNADSPWPIASLTKLMTAVVSNEAMQFSQPIALTDRAVAAEGVAGNFVAGEIFSASDLVQAMLIISSNDAAMALAESYGYDAFIFLMNETARRIGLEQTSFVDSAGLSPGNVSTADDLEKLVLYIEDQHPSLLDITAQPSTTIIELTTNTSRSIPTNNLFAAHADFIGGKTGYTDEASGNLLSIFRHHSRLYLIVVLGTEDRFGDTERLFSWLRNNF